MIDLLGQYENGTYKVKIYSDGTKIRFSKTDAFNAKFAENIDIKITDKCNAGCAFCHEGSSKCGKNADLLNLKFIDTLHPYQELAIGGGNVFEHPDLKKFLIKLKEKNVIANLTINWIHFIEYYDYLVELKTNGLVNGIGVSLTDDNQDFYDKLSAFPFKNDLVLHVINGIVNVDLLKKYSNMGLKLLILGYKQLRRGDIYYMAHKENIAKQQQELFKAYVDGELHFNVISFDNLAIDQFNSFGKFVDDETWDECYMGDEGSCTFYIDAVNQKFAINSTAPIDDRMDLLDDVDEMFKIVHSKV